jgi:antitoxin ParD1/3/4
MSTQVAKYISGAFIFAVLVPRSRSDTMRWKATSGADWQNLPKSDKVVCMSTMNISLPDSLKDYVDEQVSEGGYGTSSEYVRELIRKDQDRKRLRAMILQGATSGLAGPVDSDYFESLRARARTSRK